MRILDVKDVQGSTIRLSEYTHIRAFHACRAEDEQVFRIKGLKPYTKDEALAFAIRELENNHVSRQAIESEFHSLWKDNTPSKVWLMLETTELLSISSHYLIYGSEFINALAMRLGCRDRLKEIGKPMIVVCNVPITDIPQCWLSELEQDVKSRNTANRSIAVNLVAPENVFDITYPTGYIRDPYSWGWYKL